MGSSELREEAQNNDGKNYEDKQWLAARLREALELNGMKQTGLLLLLEENGHQIKQQRMSHLMMGRNYPDPLDLREMAKVLGVSVDWLVGLTDQSLPAADLDEMLSQAKGDGPIDRVLQKLSKEKQRQVLDFAEFLLLRDDDSSKKESVSAFERWVATTEVLTRRLGSDGDQSFLELLIAERPDLAATLGIIAKEKTVQNR